VWERGGFQLQQGDSTLQCHSAVAENQPANKNRMTTELSNFAARLRKAIQGRDAALRRPDSAARCPYQESEFNTFALELFALQFKYNSAYRIICEAQKRTPEVVEHWTQIPAVPTAAFKELELTCLVPSERTAVFHSSGTTGQKQSHHFHNAESLAVYEASMWKWFEQNIFANSKLKTQNSKLICLTPPPEQAPHSSLVHMFETVRRKLGGASVLASRAKFLGKIAADGTWTLDFEATLAALDDNSKLKTQNPKLLLGTAFSFVHLLDFFAENNLSYRLPPGSRVMETGGYKNRSRTMPKDELHALITERLGIPQNHIICEYGMSELSSQAYDSQIPTQNSKLKVKNSEREFRFPPWARVQIVSPETGREVMDGETGLIRVFDLANVFSVMAIQTEDLGVRRGDGFELIGRAQFAEPRGCSLMSVESK
jgi:Acyl-protein synthetase, LuxE